MAATERTLEDKLVQLDCTIQALGAVQQLLNLCQPRTRINANALGSLLFVLHNEFADNLKQLDQPDAPPSQ